jgi:hypothetical protein
MKQIGRPRPIPATSQTLKQCGCFGLGFIAIEARDPKTSNADRIDRHYQLYVRDAGSRGLNSQQRLCVTQFVKQETPKTGGHRINDGGHFRAA